MSALAVPRGTPPEPPRDAEQVFGSRLALAREYTAILAGAGTERGLLGPREVPRLWERHVLNCAAVAPLIPPGAVVHDIGSGAGLPGLVLAIARPDLTLTLVEPLLRRATFLSETVADLGLSGVTVLRARAEELPRGSASVVTARAVAPLERLLPWCLPVLRPSGVLLALKGRGARDELLATRPLLERLGVAAEVLALRPSADLEPTWVIRATAAESGAGRRTGPPTGAARPSRSAATGDRGRQRPSRGGTRRDCG